MNSKTIFSNSGRILKSPNLKKFTTIPNEILQRKDLSLAAKGLLAQLLSLPDDWIINKKQLPEMCNCGYTYINSAFKELEDIGYIKSKRVIGERGRFIGWDYEISDTISPILENHESVSPNRGFPKSENPNTENPTSENLQLLNTNSTNTNNTKKHTYSPKPEISEFLDFCKEEMKSNGMEYSPYEYPLRSKYDTWLENNWKDGHNKPIKNWKLKIKNTIPFLKPVYHNKSAPAASKYEQSISEAINNYKPLLQ